MSKKHKHVYLVGNERQGYVAHAFDKKIAKGYVKQYKHYYYRKVKNTIKLKQFLVDDNEIHAYDGGLYLTDSEEMYAFEALGQFFIDIEYTLTAVMENSHYLKLTDEERYQLKAFSKYIFNFIYKYNNDDFGSDLLNQKGMLKHFVKHVMDGSVK